MQGFAPSPPRRRRRATLAPMIDVVFLLLIFFMLAARFGTEGAVTLTAGGGPAATWEGPPRLVTLTPDGPRLNGRAVARTALADAIRRLSPDPDAPWALAVAEGVDVQAMVALIEALGAAGLPAPVLVE